jgi:Sulfotransferase family
VFVGGTGRSGTTVFSRLLGTHPRVFTLRWESQFVVAKHGLIDVIDADFAKPQLETFFERLHGRWFNRVLNPGKPNEYEAGLSSDISADQLKAEAARFSQELTDRDGRSGTALAADFVRRLIEPPTVAAGASRWCEKTPRNCLYVDRLAEMFPDALFVNVLRDGRDVACSMVERGFWPIAATHRFPETSRFRGEVTFEKAIEYWAEIVCLARGVASRIRPERYMEVRLEDLVREQEATVGRVLAFLEEPVAESLIAFPMREASLGRWRRELRPDQVRLAEERAGETLASAGYALSAA